MPAAEFPMSSFPSRRHFFRFGHRFAFDKITSTTLRIYCSSAMPSICLRGKVALARKCAASSPNNSRRAVDSNRPGAAGPGLPRRPRPGRCADGAGRQGAGYCRSELYYLASTVEVRLSEAGRANDDGVGNDVPQGAGTWAEPAHHPAHEVKIPA